MGNIVEAGGFGDTRIPSDGEEYDPNVFHVNRSEQSPTSPPITHKYQDMMLDENIDPS